MCGQGCKGGSCDLRWWRRAGEVMVAVNRGGENGGGFEKGGGSNLKWRRGKERASSSRGGEGDGGNFRRRRGFEAVMQNWGVGIGQ